jgi:hypothetical protein
MKKCLRFQEFKKKYENTNLSSDDILKEFVDAYDSKLDEEKSDENEYLEAMNTSQNESEDNEHKKYGDKYMPPLPAMGSNYKKKGGNKNSDLDNGNKNQEINSSDIQINIDESEENKKNGTNKNKKEEKKNDKNNNCIMNYDKFLELKNKIFYIFENNSSNKEKEKILNLLKHNYNYQNFVNNKNSCNNKNNNNNK